MNIRIKRLDDYGRGIGIVNDKVTFIPNALEDELVEYKIVSEKKKFNLAKNIKVLEKSSNRVDPLCKYYDVCGGCNLEHFSEEYEDYFKVSKVRRILSKFSSYEIDDIPIVSLNSYSYRNKIVFRVDNHKLCLVKASSNDLVEVSECILVDDKLNSIIEVINEFLKDEDDIKMIMLRCGNKTEEIMISIIGRVKNVNKFKNISNSLVINDKVITNKYISSYIGDKIFHIRHNSFFQINNNIVEELYNEVLNNVKELECKNVIDLYSGVGSIGIFIADYVKKVLCIEVVPDAYLDFLENKKINNCNNVEFLSGRVEDLVNDIKSVKKYDTVIVDPPRSGLDKVTIEFLKKYDFNNIIYVSCDQVTFARDLNMLKDKYYLKSIKLFNMFPRTYHVESLSVLERR